MRPSQPNSDETVMANNPNATANLKPFKKGDSRINRKGKPKDFEQLRKEAIKVAGEILTSSDGAHAASRVHLILNDWANSKDVRKQQLFLAYAFGNVPNEEKHSGTVTLKHDRITDDERAKRVAEIIDKARTRGTGQPADADDSSTG